MDKTRGKLSKNLGRHGMAFTFTKKFIIFDQKKIKINQRPYQLISVPFGFQQEHPEQYFPRHENV